MMWPFQRKVEVRDSSLTDALVASIVASAGGTSHANPSATAALESASSMVARGFAAARVEGPPRLTAAITPSLLSTIGRALIRRGELVLAIDVDPDGVVSLTPAADWDVTGDFDPASWFYRVNLAGPSRFTTRAMLPSAAVLHPRYQTDPETPWRGIGPLQSASLAGRLSALTTAALADAESGPRGSLLPLPLAGDDPTTTQLKADLEALRGQLATVESVRSLAPGAAGNAPAGDWESKRIGANPPTAEVALMQAATAEVLAACGAAGLFDSRDGTGQRESYRRWLHGTLAPCGRLVGEEMSKKLGAEVALSFDSLFAADLSGRARAFQSMVGGGMDVSRAAGLAGLMDTEA